MRLKWFYLVGLVALFGVAIFAPYPKLITQGSTECSLCIGDCWSTMADSCSYAPNNGIAFLETYQIITAICWSTTCDMEIDITCFYEDDLGRRMGFYTMTVGCVVPNCFVCLNN